MKILDQHMRLAFRNYQFARALMLRCAVSSEYTADSPFPLPPAKELAQRLQDLARLACAVTNADGYNGERYNFQFSKDFGGGDIDAIYARIIAEESMALVPSNPAITVPPSAGPLNLVVGRNPLTRE